MRRGSYFALILTLAAASTATAQAPATSSPLTGPIVLSSPYGGDKNSKATDEARAFQLKRVSGRTVHKAVRKLRKLTWHSKLERAQKQAQLTNKPIVWIQALGDLKGYV